MNAPAQTRLGWTLVATLPALALLAWQASAVWPFFSDDAFISLRYSERLLAGHGLTWTDGERVEGYSNLLWVLLCALLGACGMDLVDGARLLGGVCTALGFFALAHAMRPRDARSALLAALSPLVAASTQVVLAWTFSGLEGPLVFCLLAFGFGALVRAIDAEPDVAQWPRTVLLRASVPFTLACWTRPDAPLWVAATAAGLVFATSGGLAVRMRSVVAFAALPFAAFVAQLLFRLAYHGDVVPNTAHVKADFDPSTFGAGCSYVLAALMEHQGATFLAFAGLLGWLLHWTTRAKVLVLALPLAAWLLYLIAIGGDHFPGRRLLHGAVAPMALLAMGTGLFALRLPWVVGGFALLIGLGTARARSDAQTAELATETWEWRGEVVGKALHRAFAPEQPLLAVDAAGAVPFFSQLPSLDLLGLCDRTIAKTPMPAWLATMRPEIPRPPGHLKGNGAYVMERAPDLLLFSNPPGLPLPVFVSACEFEDDPRFLNGYRCVLVELPPQPLRAGAPETMAVPLWLRTEGRVGVQRTADTVTIPAYVFGALQLDGPIQRRHQPPTQDAAIEAAVAARMGRVVAWYGARSAVTVPGADGRFELELRDDAPTAFDVALPTGRWQVQLEPGDAPIDVTPRAIDANAAPTHALQLQRRAGSGPVRVRTVVLRRQG